MSFSSLIVRLGLFQGAIFGLIWLTACGQPRTERGLRSARPKQFFDVQAVKPQDVPLDCSVRNPERCHESIQKLITETLVEKRKKIDELEKQQQLLRTQLLKSQEDLKQAQAEGGGDCDCAEASQNIRELEQQLISVADQKSVMEAEVLASRARIEELTEALREALNSAGGFSASVTNETVSELGPEALQTQLEATEERIRDALASLTEALEAGVSNNAQVAELAQQLAQVMANQQVLLGAYCAQNGTNTRCSTLNESDSVAAPEQEGAIAGSDVDPAEFVAEDPVDERNEGEDIAAALPIDQIIPALSVYREVRSELVYTETISDPEKTEVQKILSLDLNFILRTMDQGGTNHPVRMKPFGVGADLIHGVLFPLVAQEGGTVMPMMLEVIPFEGQDAEFVRLISEKLMAALHCLDTSCLAVELVMAYTGNQVTGDQTILRMQFSVEDVSLAEAIVPRQPLNSVEGSLKLNGQPVDMRITPIDQSEEALRLFAGAATSAE